MLEIRWHGRGGQGTKTAVLLLAEAIISSRGFAQGFSQYGPERMGAPVTGFNRVDDKPIRLHCPISRPGAVVVLDESLLDVEDVAGGLKAGGFVLVNTAESPQATREHLRLSQGRVYTIDATSIALDTTGDPIPNTVMTGALIRLTGILPAQALIEGLTKKFSDTPRGAGLAQRSRETLGRAFAEIRGES
jgi:pyruvate ferredoxin oxidoreductase gamma subunit